MLCFSFAVFRSTLRVLTTIGFAMRAGQIKPSCAIIDGRISLCTFWQANSNRLKTHTSLYDIGLGLDWFGLIALLRVEIINKIKEFNSESSLV